MGVKGLWSVVSNSGKPIALETLEQKVLAIDISIWLHQAVHGVRGLGGSNVANSHLLTLFHRICKLLFYKIKPIFVFDGGVPQLKRQTMATRRLKRDAATSQAQKVRDRLLTNLLKSQAVRTALGVKGKAPSGITVPRVDSRQKDLFELPPLSVDALEPNIPQHLNEKTEEIADIFSNIQEFDSDDPDFKKLPLQRQHEIMCDLKETRKQNNWAFVNEMPQEANNFANYQIKRLLKRCQFQDTLDEIQTEIQKTHTKELEAKLLGDLENHVSHSHRNISEESHSILAKKVVDITEVPPLEVSTTTFQSKKTSADFLTEFSKHGLIDERHLEDDTEEFSSDNEELSLNDKEKLDQLTFLKAVDCVLNESEFSQQEILNLIEHTKQEVDHDSRETSFDPSQPSTSKMHLKYTSKNNETLSSSSDDDDDDMIEVPLELPSDTIGTESTSPKSNIDVIKNTRNQSLYLKIIQQHLEDKNISSPESTNSLCKETAKTSSVGNNLTISFDVNSKTGDSDLFDDIFKPKVQSSVRKVSNPASLSSKSKNKILTATVTNSCTPEIVQVPESVTEEKRSESIKQVEMDKNKEEQLKAKIDELVKAEIEKVCKQAKKSIIEPQEKENVKLKPESQISGFKEIANPKKTNKTVDGKENISKPVEDNGHYDPIHSVPPPSVDRKNNVKIPVNKSHPKICQTELNQLQSSLVTEQNLLQKEMSKIERVASSIGDQKYKEAQELLQLFGLPYIVSPMEAEAQCAYIESIGLTHGTITDDSDVFLFGGNTVYKNFFNQARHVEVFTAQNIEQTYGLNRSKLIQMALLTGSDYTIGIEGVGAVLAMEILSEFPEKGIKSLQNLKKWWTHCQQNPLVTVSSKVKQRAKQLYIPESFPSQSIFDAYITPDVDRSSEKFSWGIPDVTALTKFTAEKFGWNSSKSSEILTPVIKKLGVKTNQTRLDNYFSKVVLVKEPQHNSKRLLEAVAKSKGETLESVPAKKIKLKKQNVVTQKDSTVKKSSATQSAISHPEASNKDELKKKQFDKLWAPEEISPQAKREEMEKVNRKKQALAVLKGKLNDNSKNNES